MASNHSGNVEKSYAFMDQTTVLESEQLNVTNSTQSPGPMSRTMNSTGHSQTQNHLPSDRKIFVGMTYIPNATERVANQIKKFVPNLVAAPRPSNKVGSLYNDMKEKLKIGQNSMVVYDIPCAGCHSTKGYIGETTWNLDDRCGPPGGHVRDLKNIDKNLRSTALVQHVATTQHEFDFGEKRILKKVRHQGLLKIHETNQILLHDGYTVNFKKDADHVTSMFFNLLQQSERKAKSRKKSKCKPRTTSTPTPKYRY